MPRIQPTTLNDAPPASRDLLEALKKGMGMVPNLYATIGHSPAALGVLLSASASLGKGSLPAREIEMINVYTSELNGCGYCVSAHGMLAKGAGLSQDEIDEVRSGRGRSDRETALLKLVQRVVRTGGGGTATELAQARAAGVSDAEIIELLAHVALKTFTTAVASVAQTEIDLPKQPRLPQW